MLKLLADYTFAVRGFFLKKIVVFVLADHVVTNIILHIYTILVNNMCIKSIKVAIVRIWNHRHNLVSSREARA